MQPLEIEQKLFFPQSCADNFETFLIFQRSDYGLWSA